MATPHFRAEKSIQSPVGPQGVEEDSSTERAFFLLLESKNSQRSVNTEPQLCLVLGKGYILR